MARPKGYIIGIFFAGLFFVSAISSAQEAAQSAAAGEQAGKFEYMSEKLRDPFEREKQEIRKPEAVKETKPLPELIIQGVVWGTKIPQAIVNNKVLKVGDEIQGVKISGINRDGITVIFDNQQYTLMKVSPLSAQDSKKEGQGQGLVSPPSPQTK
ncbi:MAG: hypothetical protein PHE18_03875 [Candidatus Omnitrophica bacterium]|nr:hypothetical protein [Candidatus Omnitrophota bacterium]MDD5552996.1 hypothetical protein [Candidatus Omnitrophota bacterium]